MPSHHERRQELEARVNTLRALVARREQQTAHGKIIESVRTELHQAEENLRTFDRSIKR